MDDCVVVIEKQAGDKGCIVRRLNAHAYEILFENGRLAVLSPDEFNEIERNEK
jgi:hypothetical protein